MKNRYFVVANQLRNSLVAEVIFVSVVSTVFTIGIPMLILYLIGAVR